MEKHKIFVYPIDKVINSHSYGIVLPEFDLFIHLADSFPKDESGKEIPSDKLKNFYWFPVDELDYWGYAPFYFTIHQFMKLKKDTPLKIGLSCHGGVNRSPTMAYYLMQIFDDFEICVGLNGESAFKRNIAKHLIPHDVVKFGKAAVQTPNYSILGIKRQIKIYENTKAVVR